jgi:uncharacterized protein (TIGR04141 family)
MSGTKKIQHLTIFLLKKSVLNFEDAVKKDSRLGKSTDLKKQKYEGVLYIPKSEVKSPSWLPFIKNGFPRKKIGENQMASALLLLKSEKRIFAIAFGHARHFLKPNLLERDFGLRVVVNRVNRNKIRGISLRMLKETRVKRQEEAAKGTDLRSFGVDIQQDLLYGVTGVPDDASLATRISGTDSLVIDVAIKFSELGEKCKKLLSAYNATEYLKHGFDWIDNLKIVRSPTEIEELDKKLITAIKKNDATVQLLCPETVNRLTISGFLYEGENIDSNVHAELDYEEWQLSITKVRAKITPENLRERRVKVIDEQGVLFTEIPEYDCFIFETEIKHAKYVFSNGEWFEISTDFDQEITKYINSITNKSIALPNFKVGWKDEAQYVSEAAKSPDLISMHTKTCTIGGTLIEPCDLIDRNGALIHVKVWSQSATFSHLLAQGAISAESLLRYPEFRNHIAKSVTKHKGKIRNLYPEKGFITSNLDVVLALVRKSSKPLPFFSRLNLLREGKRIERLGYRVNYQRIEVK